MGKVATIGTALMLAGCGGARAAPPVTTAMLAPSPPGWFAFCAEHGGDCVRIPDAAAMPDGKPAAAPAAWREYCRRNRADAAC